MIVARNPGQAKRATVFSERLRLGIAVIHGEADRELPENDISDGRNSPPLLNDSIELKERKSVFEIPNLAMPVRLNPREKQPIDVVGDVSGRIAIIVVCVVWVLLLLSLFNFYNFLSQEDMIDDITAFVRAADVLNERGAYKIYVVATHGLFSSDAPRLLDESNIDEVIVTNTVPHEVQKMQCHKIKTVDISLLLSEAIRRIHNQESMSYLFRDITAED